MVAHEKLVSSRDQLCQRPCKLHLTKGKRHIWLSSKGPISDPFDRFTGGEKKKNKLRRSFSSPGPIKPQLVASVSGGENWSWGGGWRER